MLNALHLHAANILYLASYSVRDILWLRILTVVGMCMCIPYYVAEGVMPPVYWHVAFVAINLYHIVRLFIERKPIVLSEIESFIREHAFPNLTPHQVRRIVSDGEWKTYVTGQQVVQEDAELESLILLYAGRVKVKSNNTTIAHLGAGQFVGEMSFLAGGRATADVTAVDDIKSIEWSESTVRSADWGPELRSAFQAALGADVVGKLLAMRSNPVELQTLHGC